MPLPLAAALSAGTSILNTGAQIYTNARNRQNALSDWNRQNAFNAPAQQMQRFKEAGLNPNLIYKQTNEAAPVRSTDFVAPQLEDPQGILSKSNQLKIQDQQFQNMQLQNQAIEAQIAKTKADTIFVASNTDFKNLDIKRLQGQLPGLVEGVMLRNEQYKAQIANTLQDTKNKIEQLPIIEATKNKLNAEVSKLIQSNAFISLEKNTQLAVQNAMIQSLKQATQQKMNENAIGKLEVETRQRLENALKGSGSTTGAKIITFFGDIFKTLIKR
jgi:hypothetical protein